MRDMDNEWDRDVRYVREDIKEVRDAIIRLEMRVEEWQAQTVTQAQWETWKREVWDPYQTRVAQALRGTERRTSMWLGLLAGAILTGLVSLVVRLLA